MVSVLKQGLPGDGCKGRQESHLASPRERLPARYFILILNREGVFRATLKRKFELLIVAMIIG